MDDVQNSGGISGGGLQAPQDSPRPVDSSALSAGPQEARRGGEETDDFDTLLRQYDAKTRGEPKQPQTTSAADHLKMADLYSETRSAHSQVATLLAQQMAQRNSADFDFTVSRFGEELKQFPHMPEDYAERWLRAESSKDSALRQAFDNRYEDPRAFEMQTRRALQRFSKELRSMPDRETTENAMAVSAAVRGASREPVQGPPPRLGQMSDKDFREYVKSNYGYQSGI